MTAPQPFELVSEALPVLSGAAVRSIGFLALAALALAPWEVLVPAGQGKRRWTEAGPSVLTDLLFATVGQMGVRLGVLIALEALWSRVFPWSLETPLWVTLGITSPALRTTAEIASGLLLFDLGGYLYHRLAHASPTLWRLHSVHHSSTHLDWLASFREHPLEILLFTTFQNLPLILLGIPLGVHTAVIVLLKLWTVFVHADIRVRGGARLSALIATPAYHRRHHHAQGPARNFATLFPFVDRLFGTWEPASSERGRVGLDAPIPSTFGRLLLHPFVRPQRAFEGDDRLRRP